MTPVQSRRLTRVAQAITASLDLDKVLDAVVHAVMHLVSDASARIWVLEGDHLQLASEAGNHGPAGGGHTHAFAIGQGLTGHVARTRAPLVVLDVTSDARTVNVDWMRRQAIVSYVGLPLLAGNRLMGVLSVHVRRRHEFTDEELDLLTSFGTLAAMAINNARVYEESEARRRAAEGLAGAARALTESLDVSTVGERIVETVCPLFGARYAVLRLLRPDGSLVAIACAGDAREHFEPGHVQPAGVGFVGRAITDGCAAWTPDLQAETHLLLNEDLQRRILRSKMRAFLAAPLKAHGRTTGVLCVGYGQPRSFTTDEITLLGTFADQAALALENARLYQAATEHAAEISRLGREAEARETFIRSVIESLGEGLVVLCGEGRVVAWNLGMERITDLPARHAVGRMWHELFGDFSAAVRDTVARLLAGRIDEFRVEGAERRVGSARPLALNVTGSRLKCSTGAEGAVLLVEDITGRVGLERAARQAEKLAALGTLSAGAAHEINNPIGIISSRIEVMLGETESQQLPGGFRTDLQVILRNARRVAGIVQRLLAFSRSACGAMAQVDLNRVVNDTLALVRTRMAAHGIRVQCETDPRLPPVLGDANALQQVVLNLLTNASEAIERGGDVRIRTSVVPGVPDRVRLAVCDSGTGIPADVLGRIFEPFYTTKEQGTGLGLSVIYGIVREHHGVIDVESEPGRGATFTVTLPVLLEAPVAPAAALADAPLAALADLPPAALADTPSASVADGSSPGLANAPLASVADVPARPRGFIPGGSPARPGA